MMQDGQTLNQQSISVIVFKALAESVVLVCFSSEYYPVLFVPFK